MAYHTIPVKQCYCYYYNWAIDENGWEGKEREGKENLGEEREGGLLVGYRASDGDEFALLYFLLEAYSLFDGRKRTCTLATARSHHRSLGSD